MANVVITWNGDEVKRRAEIAARHTPYELGLAIEGQAKLLAPVDTGRLRGSITTASGDGTHTNPSGPGANSSDKLQTPEAPNITHVGTPVDYAPHQEYGTIRMAAQAFLRPALDIIRGKALSIVSKTAKQDFGEYLHTGGK